MSDPINPHDICPRPQRLPPLSTAPLSNPLYLSSVYRCESPDQADAVLTGQVIDGFHTGYGYSRDGHPNGDLLAEKCRQLHGSQRAIVAASGMGALAIALLSQCQTGDHVVLSNRLYGRSFGLFVQEAGRLGIRSSVVDTNDLAATAAAFNARTKLLLVETISNPLLRVADLTALAEIAHRHDVQLFVDNTFASPVVCRPIEWGADLVHESLTKIMNGHSDVVLGLLCGSEQNWSRVADVASIWGLTAGPFDCWLAARGISTLHLRAQRAGDNALVVAEFLQSQPGIDAVHYPGLTTHPDHALARRQFGRHFGSMVTFTLSGGRAAAVRFIQGCVEIPFCPSLGEAGTTLSHPESTSHRGMTADQRADLGIFGGTIRLSVGTESAEFIVQALSGGLSVQ